MHALVCHRDYRNAMICLGSLLRYSADPIRLVLHDDGSLSSAEKDQLKDCLGAELIERRDADRIMTERLAAFHNASTFRLGNVLGLKLLDVVLLSDTEDVAYADSDVLFLRSFSGLFRWPDETICALFMKDHQNGYSLQPWHCWRTPVLDRVNTGLFMVRAGGYDLDYVDWLAGRPWIRRIPQWAEQSCWAALGARLRCHMWSARQICVARDREQHYDGLIACHFVGATRRFVGVTIRSTYEAGPTAAKVRTVPARQAGCLGLLSAQLRRKSSAIAAKRYAVDSEVRELQ